MAQKFSSGVSSWMLCVGPISSPPSRPMVFKRVITSALDLLRCAKGKGLLNIERSPKAQIPAVFIFQPYRVHGGRLDRIQYIQADFDQIRDDRINHAIGMVGDLDALD